jgi:hypothetical protein
VTLEHQADSNDGIVIDLVELRNREQPGRNDDDSATQTVAERLNEWTRQSGAERTRTWGTAAELLEFGSRPLLGGDRAPVFDACLCL